MGLYAELITVWSCTHNSHCSYSLKTAGTKSTLGKYVARRRIDKWGLLTTTCCVIALLSARFGHGFRQTAPI